MYTYALEIFCSEEDDGYITVVPELPGCFAYGESEELALQEIKTALDLWLSTARDTGREIPRPCGREVLRDLLAEHSRLEAIRTIIS